MANFLVRETLGYEEFSEARIRLWEEQTGIDPAERNFGLPPISEWDWWDDDYEYGYMGGMDVTTGDAEHQHDPAATAAAASSPEQGAEPPVSAAPGSSPSHRVGAASEHSAPGPVSDPGKPKIPQDVSEVSLADSFIMGVLRGWRLLKAASLTPEETRDILSTTQNKLDFEAISQALSALWDEQLLGHRYSQHAGRHGSSNNALWHEWHDDGWDDGYEINYDEMWTWGNDDGWWNDGQYHDEWHEHEWPDETSSAKEVQTTLSPDEEERLQDALQAEQVAEQLAAEARRTWQEAQKTTQQLKRDRGFGHVNTVNNGRCFNCGGNHLVRDCPDRRHGNYPKGKFSGKGKGMFWSSKGKSPYHSKDGNGKGFNKNPVNAYALYGMELASTTKASTSTGSSSLASQAHGMLDCGATASAAPEVSAQELVIAVLSHDRQATVNIFSAQRPYFRFGNGKWGRARYKLEICSDVSGQKKTFSLYALPNPIEFYQPNFDKSQLEKLNNKVQYLLEKPNVENSLKVPKSKAASKNVEKKMVVTMGYMDQSSPMTSPSDSSWDPILDSPDRRNLEDFLTEQVMKMVTMMTATMSHLALQIAMDGRECLWEIACADNSWLTQAALNHGLPARRINYKQGFDLYKKSAWMEMERLRKIKRPKKLWLSLPCTHWCQWTNVNYNTDERKAVLEDLRRRDRRMMHYAKDFILNAVDDDPDIDVYWVCPRNHQHAFIQGIETARSAYYPVRMVEAIVRHWKNQLAPQRHVQALTSPDAVVNSKHAECDVKWTQRLQALPVEEVLPPVPDDGDLSDGYEPSILEAPQHGHPSNRNLIHLFRDAGLPKWKIEMARDFRCDACDRLLQGSKSSGEVPRASTHPLCKAWEIVGADSSEWHVPDQKIKIKFILLIDFATKLRAVHVVKSYGLTQMLSESSEDVIKAIAEKWLADKPKPRLIVPDNSSVFRATDVNEFLTNVGIQLSLPAEKESWAHGLVESAIKDVKMTASAIQLGQPTLPPGVSLQLACAALNSTEYTKGYSSFQWCYGKDYTITDEEINECEHPDLPDRPDESTAVPAAVAKKAKKVFQKGVTFSDPALQPRSKIVGKKSLTPDELHQPDDGLLDFYHLVVDNDLDCLSMQFDLDFVSNRQFKNFLRSPTAYLVKKMRDSEVVLSKLSPQHRELFARAKGKEIDSFLKNEAVKACHRNEEVREAMGSGRIVRARWVLTWKLVPPEDQDEARQDASTNPSTTHTSDGLKKAKARIVLLGFEHPEIGNVDYKTSSPVQSMLARNLLYQATCQHSWQLEGLDLATAFLQTAPTSADANLWTYGVAELRTALGLDSNGIMKVMRNIYGSTTAPRGLWLDLHKTLTGLGGYPALGERCLWVWYDEDPETKQPFTIGMMGGHVDDFHRTGDSNNAKWNEVCRKIDAAYRWGTTKHSAYRHADTDIQVKRDNDGDLVITVNQQYYVDSLPDLGISADRLRQEDARMTSHEIAACRGALGALQWLAIQTQPQLCARCNLLLTEVIKFGKMSYAMEIQRMIGEIRRESYELKFFKHKTAKTCDYDLGDSLTKKRPDCRVGLQKFLKTWLWAVKYDPQFIASKKNKKEGKTAINQIDDYLSGKPDLSFYAGATDPCQVRHYDFMFDHWPLSAMLGSGGAPFL
ncbi:unnamed protein product [Cladocopium goreaui]|uniref:Integrase catalytic domain-containing protein n=1 Tax=Cladocopium goreaui TaxID=2562237 RepID=A0A9P1DR11_9DINO|nr:unnamed protein product [Cladocopium goreaui]